MEAFSNNHLKYQLINPNVGGPKKSDQLYSENKLKNDFTGFKFKTLKEEEIFSMKENTIMEKLKL